jgi:hypothetical protein
MELVERDAYLSQRMREECRPLLINAGNVLGLEMSDEPRANALAELCAKSFWIGVRFGAAETNAQAVEHEHDFNPDGPLAA